MRSTTGRSVRKAAALVAVAAALFAGGAQAEEKQKPRVAVRAFAAKGVDPSVAATLETSFCTALGDKVDAICPDEIKAIMGAKQIQLGTGGCANEDECLNEIAKVSNATRIVTGEVSKLGELYLISVALIEASTNKVLARATERTGKLEDLLDKVESLATKLAAAR